MNINKLKSFGVFIYFFGYLNTVQINHVHLLSSDVQHNDDLHYVVVKPNHATVFNVIKINQSSEAMVIHLPMILKSLLFIEFCLILLIIVYYNIYSIRMGENDELYHQNTMFVNFIDGQFDENVIALAIFIIELTIDKIVIVELTQHLFNLFLIDNCNAETYDHPLYGWKL